MRNVTAALLFLLASCLLGQDISRINASSEKNPPPLNVPTYDESHDAGKLFATGCTGPGPASWIDLCDGMMEALAGTIATQTPVAADTFMFIHNGQLYNGTIGSIFTGGAASTTSTFKPVTDTVTGTVGGVSANIPTGMLRGGSGGMTCYDEMFGVSSAATNAEFDCNVRISDTGTGAGYDNPTITPASNHPGITSIYTGTTLTGQTALVAGGTHTTSNSTSRVSITLGGGAIKAGAITRWTTASTGSETYFAYMGFSDTDWSTTWADAVDGVYFRYNEATNSAKWQGVARAASVETTCDTGVTFAAAAWHTYEISINAAGTSAEFFYDGVSKCTISSGLPTAATGYVPIAIRKTLGTTTREAIIDVYWLLMDFTTPR